MDRAATMRVFFSSTAFVLLVMCLSGCATMTLWGGAGVGALRGSAAAVRPVGLEIAEDGAAEFYVGIGHVRGRDGGVYFFTIPSDWKNRSIVGDGSAHRLEEAL